MSRPRRTTCKDCGSPDISWASGWAGPGGPHSCRCHPCYLAYTRARQNARGHGRLIGPPKPAHMRHQSTKEQP